MIVHIPTAIHQHHEDHVSRSVQLASFMSELQSSGLLEKDAAQAAEQTGTAGKGAMADPGSATSRSPELHSSQNGTPTAEPNLAAAIVDAVTDDSAGVPEQQSLSSLPNQEVDVSADADGSVSEPAEQRVLGDLKGAPTWREVFFFVYLCTLSAVCWYSLVACILPDRCLYSRHGGIDKAMRPTCSFFQAAMAALGVNLSNVHVSC